MTWYALKAEDSEGNRDVHREHAARLPFLLEQGLGESDWPDRRCWSIRRADDFGRVFTEVELLTLALRTDRILITRNPAFLDDLQFSPSACPGVIVLGEQWLPRLDEFLVSIATLLGPFRALYHGVKVDASSGGVVEIAGPAGGKRRVARRFVLDSDGMPLLAHASGSFAFAKICGHTPESVGLVTRLAPTGSSTIIPPVERDESGRIDD